MADETTEELLRQKGQPPIGMAMAMPNPPQPLPRAAAPTAMPAAPDVASSPASAPAMPVGGMATPQRPAFQLPPDKKSLTTQLWDKTGGIQNPFERILARTGVGLSKALDIAGSALVPGIAMNIPGSQANTQLQNNRQDKQALETQRANAPAEAALDARAADAPRIESEIDKNKAETAKANADAEKAGRPEVPKNENPQQGYANAISEALAAGRDPNTDPHVQAWKNAVTELQKQPNPNEEDKSIQDYEKAHNEQDTPANRDAARDAIKTRDKVQRPPTDREEWQKDHPGEPIENYWTAKAGAGGAAKAQAGEESGRAAQAYADDYLKSGKFTGAGDEALMEKYFELAKPSSGFRMTQPQIEMLTKARDLMNGIVAKGKHLFTPNAPYFSNEQRQQIVDTMKNLQAARDEVKGGGSSKSSKKSDADPLGIL